MSRPSRRLVHALALVLVSTGGLVPRPARAVSLVLDRLGTPDVVQAGEIVSFSFAFEFEPDEVLLATQAEISAPHLTDFQFPNASGIVGPNPWDLTSTFRRMGVNRDGNPMWFHAEDVYSPDPMGVTWEEVGGIAPVGRFSATATYNGEIVFDLSTWEFLLLEGFSTEPGRFGTISSKVPLDPAWAHIQTGVTIVGGLELPPPPAPEPPPAVEPPPPTYPAPPVSELPSNGGPGVDDGGSVILREFPQADAPEPGASAVVLLGLGLVGWLRRLRARA